MIRLTQRIELTNEQINEAVSHYIEKHIGKVIPVTSNSYRLISENDGFGYPVPKGTKIGLWIEQSV